MKYILEASKFYKFIKRGSNNKVFNLDKHWIIKMPLRPDEIEGGTVHKMPLLLKNFKYHVDMMLKYPDIFPKVKKLDKYRIAVEKCDVVTAKNEIRKIYRYICNSFRNDPHKKFDINYLDFIDLLIEDDEAMNILKKGDSVCRRWYLFLLKLKNSELYKNKNGYLDNHEENFGIDYHGNIKMIDF